MIDRLSEIFAKARVKASRLSSKILLGPTAGGLPLTSIRSLEEVLYREFIKNHVADIVTIYEPNIVKYKFPENYPPCFRRNKTFEKRQLYVLKDVCVSPASGMAWLPEGYILEESVGSLLRMMGWGGILHEPLLRSQTLSIDGPIVACPPTGYFHWLLEIMPNILNVLSRFPESKILVSTKSPKYLLDALKLLLGSEEYKTRVLFSRCPLMVSNLIMPQVEVYSGFVHLQDISRLRSTFKSEIISASKETKELIYISRSRVAKRRLMNETKLESGMRAFGFSIVYCEDMLFRKQINIFSNVKLIVGPHGAGLANMVWSDLPCKIIEIFPCEILNDCYARLAVGLGFGYDYVECERDQQSSGRIPVDVVLKKVEHKTLESD